jgi:two-component system, LuxR family, response regulator FixJ
MTLICSVVDDDEAVLDATGLLLRTSGITTVTYARAQIFLDAPIVSGCVLSDIRMPGLTGLNLLSALKTRSDPRPVVFMTGHADVSTAVWALRNGAFDFVEKPCEPERLVETIKTALEMSQRRQDEVAELTILSDRFAALTDRQRAVMVLTAAGLSSKHVAQRLSISPRTVETYRAGVMHKMEFRSLADLVRVHDQLKATDKLGAKIEYQHLDTEHEQIE